MGKTASKTFVTVTPADTEKGNEGETLAPTENIKDKGTSTATEGDGPVIPKLAAILAGKWPYKERLQTLLDLETLLDKGKTGTDKISPLVDKLQLVILVTILGHVVICVKPEHNCRRSCALWLYEALHHV